MTRELGITVAVIGLVWLGYMTWLTGYRNGYEEGSGTAMQRVERLIVDPEGTRSELADSEFAPLPDEL